MHDKNGVAEYTKYGKRVCFGKQLKLKALAVLEKSMQVEYKSDLNELMLQGILELIDSVGWPSRKIEDIKEAFHKSTFVRVASSGDKIIGFGRTVDDGKYYGMVVDLIVHPDFQGQGIGSEILSQLANEMEGFYTISLTAARSKIDFYKRRGWKESKSTMSWKKK